MVEFYLSILNSPSMVTFLLGFSAVILFLAHALCLGAFLLDIFFDTSFTTVNERARAIGVYIAYVLAIWIAMAVVLVVLMFRIADVG